MKKLVLSGPHWELRVSVTDEMTEDFKKCQKRIVESDFTADTDCEHCSWKDTHLPCEMGCRACELKGVEDFFDEGQNA